MSIYIVISLAAEDNRVGEGQQSHCDSFIVVALSHHYRGIGDCVF